MEIFGEIVIILLGLYMIIGGLSMSYMCLVFSDKTGWFTLCIAGLGVYVIYLACKYGPLTLGIN